LAITVSPDRIILTGVSYIEAGFEASWTDVAVFAEVTFPDLLSVDVINPLDIVTKQVSKLNTDSFSGSDTLVQTFEKALVDIITITEGPEFTYTYGARESDTQALADAFRYAKSKLLAPETLHLIDNMDGNIEFALIKVIGELQLLQEEISNNLGKNLADSVAPTDVFSKFLTIVRAFTEELVSSDDTTKNFSKLLADEQSNTDSAALNHNKPLADESTALEDSYWHFYLAVFGVDETLSTSDIFLSERIYGRFPVDAVNLGDGGVLSMQDYTSITYFAADYVGVGRIL
jgi:hypothetical protein